MAILLGVDTGGTYTDAVLVRDDKEVLASAKALTTRGDLAVGVSGAVASVLEQSGVKGTDVRLAALSTTLATNALVEGQGGRVGLIYVGFRESDLAKHGLADALKGDPSITLAGGHSHAGTEVEALDIASLKTFLAAEDVSAYAVAAQFATRNPAHELAVAQRIAQATGKPATCSHQLSAKLNGPKRALTALLNARLIGMISQLIDRTESSLHDLGVHAPLMVVRGDGALMSADQARTKPIETILSGPAASLVGAKWLTGADNALVSDIGGTTTDIALLRDGRPTIDPEGAQIGGFRTMVEAVAMRTTGLGGDSEVRVQSEGLQGGVTLGPRRLVPLSLLAEDHPGVLRKLDAQQRNPLPGEHDGRFVRRVPDSPVQGLGHRESTVLGRISEVHPIGDVVHNRMDQGALQRLWDRGLVQISGITPSDAAHMLGFTKAWNYEAAKLGLILMARRRVGSGALLAETPEALARIIVEQLTEQTVSTVLEAAFAEEDPVFDEAASHLAHHILTRRGLDRHRGLLAIDIRLNLPVIGLGASASSYYPAVGARLGCDMILPEHAGVANAIGAVVGRVTSRQSGVVTSPAEGKYRAHLPNGPEDFEKVEDALKRLEELLRAQVMFDARSAGAENIDVHVTKDIKTAQAEAREVFVEGIVAVEASGRPRIALD